MDTEVTEVTAVTAVVETVPVAIDKETGELIVSGQTQQPENRDLAILNGKGIKNLIIGIVQQAVDDVKALTKAGVIVGGKVVVEKMPHRACEDMTIPEAKELVDFFKDDNIGLYLNYGGIDIEPKRFRQKLGFSW